jgi:hypothetical protein
MAKDEVKEEKISPLVKNMIKGMLPMVTSNTTKISLSLKDYLSKIELMEWENRAAILLIIDKTDTAQIITCTLDAENTVKRRLSKVSIVEFIQMLIKNM